MKCQKCGKEIADDNNYCEYCGAEISKPRSIIFFWIVLIVLLVLSAWGAGSFFVCDSHRQHMKEVAEAKVAQEQAERRAKEALRLAEEAREKAREDSIVRQIEEEESGRLEKIKAAERAGYVDLGLQSGTLWKKTPEGIYDGLYTDAMKKYGKGRIPSQEQWNELIDNCSREWYEYEKKTESIGTDGTKYFGWRMVRGIRFTGKMVTILIWRLKIMALVESGLNIFHHHLQSIPCGIL